jgi:uncharacterized membrane protein YkvI
MSEIGTADTASPHMPGSGHLSETSIDEGETIKLGSGHNLKGEKFDVTRKSIGKSNQFTLFLVRTIERIASLLSTRSERLQTLRESKGFLLYPATLLSVLWIIRNVGIIKQASEDLKKDYPMCTISSNHGIAIFAVTALALLFL